jgi:RNA polymerase sigma-70 factor (ECF subfamily)
MSCVNDLTTESTLVTNMIAGDVMAIENFVSQHQGDLIAAAKRILIDPSLAEDCVQETFISVMVHINSFQGRSSLKTWLHKILINKCLMKLRKKKTLNEGSLDELMPIFDGNGCRIEAPWLVFESPESILERENSLTFITQKIDQLPEQYRIVIMLRDIEELSTKEVAKLLDYTEANIKVRLHRARSALKKRVEPLLRGEGV